MVPKGVRQMALNGPTELSSRLSRPAVEPERTRISCYVALTSAHVCGFQ
jgi:hypothetical protein